MEGILRFARPVVALVVGFTVAIGPARGQSVGENGAPERKKRAPTARPVKVYTDADLDAMRASRPEAPPSETPKALPTEPTPDAAAEPAKDEGAERKRLEAEWRVRFADGRRQIAEAELRCWHSVVRTVFVAGIPVQQWVKEFEESEELRQTKKALVDLEEEFRKTGLPPGWTRE